MGKGTKTDNANLDAKLTLRRHFLRKYHAGQERISVFECCQGGGLLWGELKKEFPADVWGVDLKPKKGRLKIDSIRVLQQPGLDRDIIDIDTYGSPWKHWFALLPNVTRPTTVFLTLGQVTTGRIGSVDTCSLEAAGLAFPTLKLPNSFHIKISEIFLGYVLARSCVYGIMLEEVVEAVSEGNARYFGARIRPRTVVADGG